MTPDPEMRPYKKPINTETAKPWQTLPMECGADLDGRGRELDNLWLLRLKRAFHVTGCVLPTEPVTQPVFGKVGKANLV
jgi:hypothetical protein